MVGSVRLSVWMLTAFIGSLLPRLQGAAADSKVVACYYSSWAHYRKGVAEYRVEDIPTDLCTHLIYAFAVLDSETFLTKSHDKWLDIDLKNFHKFVQLKEKNPNMKVLLGLGGWNDSRSTKYSRLASNPTKRRAFTQHVLEFLEEYGFDGLDLDWEYPGYESSTKDKPAFTAWVEDLHEALAPKGLMLTSAVSAGRRNIDRAYEIPRLAELLDLIFVMTYDFHGSWENKVAHHAPLYPEPGQNPEYCVDFALNYWIQLGAPPNKIVMGVPQYGRSWTLASVSESWPGAQAKGPGRAGPHLKAKGSMAYFECCQAFLQDGWSKVTGVGGPYITKGDQWVGYDDVESVTIKAKYALEQNLAGIMIWDLPSDDFSNLCGNGHNPLLTAMANILNPNKNTSSSPSSSSSRLPPKPSSSSSSFPGLPSSNDLENNLVENGGTKLVDDKQRKVGDRDNRKNSGFSSSSSSSSSGGSSTTELPYEWLAWPVFSQPPRQSTKRPTSFRTTTTPRTTTTTNRNTVNNIDVTTKLPYEWLAWPVFSQSPKSPGETKNKKNEGLSTNSRPATSTNSRPFTSANSRPATSTNSRPFTSTNNRPATSTNSRPFTSTNNRASTSINSGPSTSNNNRLSTSSSGKPPTSTNSKPFTSTNRRTSVSTNGGTSFSTNSRPSASTNSKPSTSANRRAPLSTSGQPSTSNNNIGNSINTNSDLPYDWLAWPVFSQTPEEQRKNQVPRPVITFQSQQPKTNTLPTTRPFITKPRVSQASGGEGGGSSHQTPSSPQWFSICNDIGFAPDPAACTHFYRCTNNIAYRFDCPSGLVWHQAETSCDWPEIAPCNSLG